MSGRKCNDEGGEKELLGLVQGGNEMSVLEWMAIAFWVLCGIGTFIGASSKEDEAKVFSFIACIIIWPLGVTATVIEALALYIKGKREVQ